MPLLPSKEGGPYASSYKINPSYPRSQETNKMKTHLELNYDESKLLFAAVTHYLRRLEIDAEILSRDDDPYLYKEIEIAKILSSELLSIMTGSQLNKSQTLEN